MVLVLTTLFVGGSARVNATFAVGHLGRQLLDQAAGAPDRLRPVQGGAADDGREALPAEAVDDPRAQALLAVVSRGGGLPETLRLVETYERALGLYLARCFDETLAALEEARALHPGDGPARVLIARSERDRQAPPREGGTGVHTMRTKEGEARMLREGRGDRSLRGGGVKAGGGVDLGE